MNIPADEIARPDVEYVNGERLFTTPRLKHPDVPPTMRFTEIRIDPRFQKRS